MNFLKDHFDHILLAALGIAGGLAGAFCAAHKMDDASKWFFGQAAATLAALLMRMNTTPKQLPTDSASPKV